MWSSDTKPESTAWVSKTNMTSHLKDIFFFVCSLCKLEPVRMSAPTPRGALGPMVRWPEMPGYSSILWIHSGLSVAAERWLPTKACTDAVPSMTHKSPSPPLLIFIGVCCPHPEHALSPIRFSG